MSWITLRIGRLFFFWIGQFVGTKTVAPTYKKGGGPIVDGSEIRRSTIRMGCFYIPGGCKREFSHQQY